MISNFFRRLFGRQKKTSLLDKYAQIGNSINRGIRIRLDNPIDRKYLFIGNDCIINGRFIFESKEGEISIGNHTYIGGSTFISRTKIEIGERGN